MKTHRVHVDDKTLYQFMIAGLRYSIRRDNGLASNSYIDNVKRYIGKMSKEFQNLTAKQLIEETISNIKFPELSGGYKHKCKLYSDDKYSYRVVYITDYEYKNKKLIYESDLYKYSDLEVGDDIVFEDDDEWRKFITSLSYYIDNEDWKPYNDDEGMYYKKQ